VRFIEQAANVGGDPVDLAIGVASALPDEAAAHRLFAISWRLCASPGLVRRHAGDLADGSLQAVPLAVFSRHRPFRLPRITRGGRLLAGLSEPVLLSDDIGVVREAVLQSLCVAVMPDYFVREDIAAGRLIDVYADAHIDAGDTEDGDHVYAVHLQGKGLPAHVASLIDFLTQESARQHRHC